MNPCKCQTQTAAGLHSSTQRLYPKIKCLLQMAEILCSNLRTNFKKTDLIVLVKVFKEVSDFERDYKSCAIVVRFEHWSCQTNG